jgi:hypothetical protein
MVRDFHRLQKFFWPKHFAFCALYPCYELTGALSAPYNTFFPLRSLRPFDFTQGMLCGRYSDSFGYG